MSSPLKRSVRLRCSAQHAFEVFTEKLDLWWPLSHRRFEGSSLHLEAKVGGRFFERADSGEEVLLGEVLLCEPPHRIIYTWYPGAISKPTRVDVRFREEGEYTLVEVLHTEGESALADLWPQRLEVFRKAWAEVLPAFVNCVSNYRQE